MFVLDYHLILETQFKYLKKILVGLEDMQRKTDLLREFFQLLTSISNHTS